ncbi:hypothetical protein MYCTH_2302894, partial [Thermothelomyces thermophilus ATCC 42464]
MNPGAQPRKKISRPSVPRPPAVQAAQQQQKQPAVLPSPAPSDDTSPGLSSALDSPKTNALSLADAHNMGPTSPSAPPTRPVTNFRFVYATAHTRDPQEAPEHGTVGRIDPVENYPPTQSHISQPPRSAAQVAGASYARESPPTGSGVAAPPLKRRRLDNVPPDSLQYPLLLSALEQHLQAWGGYEALEPTVEKPRVMLLREACRDNDGFFVILHQLFSIWSLNKREAYDCLPLNPPLVDQAFEMLETVLKKNELLSPTHRHWFVQFPVPAKQLAQWNNGQTVVQPIAFFLEALVNECGNMMTACVQRKYPFLVDELLGRLKCFSPVLQLILFTACRRRLGVLDGQLGSSMEQAFREDQSRHRDANGQQTLVPLTYPGELEQRNSSLIDFYRLTVQAAAFRAPGQSDHRSQPLAGQPQQHQVLPPHSGPSPFRPTYSSTAPPTSSEASSATSSPYTTAPRGTVGTGATQGVPLATNTPAYHHPNQASFVSNARYYPAGGPQDLQQRASWQLKHFLQGQQVGLQIQRKLSQLTQQTNQQQQYQHNLQFTTSLSSQTTFQPRAHLPPSTTPQYHSSPQPAQAPQLQQVHYNTRPPHGQPQAPTINFVLNGARPGSAMGTGPSTPQSQQGNTPQRQQAVGASDPLFPPKGTMIMRTDWPHDPTERKSILMSLHQAHVRSPKRVLKEGETARLYQAVKSLPVPPTAVPPKNTMYEFRFQVTEEQFARLATKSRRPGEVVPVVEHFDGALRWRVRSCMVQGSTGALSERDWVTLDTSWPSFIHMTLNHKVLDVRRKSHNGKDLPTEITDFVVRGTNVLMVAVHDSHGEKAKNCHLAVEMLETLGHSAVMDIVRSQGAIPEEETLNTIKKRLTSSVVDDDDDEISFEAPDLSIDLADPFSAKIFTIPARGADCTHMECFDLDTWLSTRPAAKPTIKCAHRQVQCDCRNAAEPSNPDKWRCPICLKDARPYSLRIDAFLLKIRKQLEADGKLHTKRLLVKADGSWSVVLEDEPDDNEAEADSDGEGRAKAANTAAAAAVAPVAAVAAVVPKRQVEVIEI